MSKRNAIRFAAKLLFQFRVISHGSSDRMRTCEERIINLAANDARSALVRAKRRGKAAEFDFRNHAGDKVRFEFVGVLDLLELGLECEPDEVWYAIRRMLAPMERRDAIVPPERELTAFRNPPRSTRT